MKLKDYLKKNKLPVSAFARNYRISRYSVHKYIRGEKPAPRQAWKIINGTDGMVSFTDLGYDMPPKNPLKDI